MTEPTEYAEIAPHDAAADAAEINAIIAKYTAMAEELEAHERLAVYQQMSAEIAAACERQRLAANGE